MRVPGTREDVRFITPRLKTQIVLRLLEKNIGGSIFKPIAVLDMVLHSQPELITANILNQVPYNLILYFLYFSPCAIPSTALLDASVMFPHTTYYTRHFNSNVFNALSCIYYSYHPFYSSLSDPSRLLLHLDIPLNVSLLHMYTYFC